MKLTIPHRVSKVLQPLARVSDTVTIVAADVCTATARSSDRGLACTVVLDAAVSDPGDATVRVADLVAAMVGDVTVESAGKTLVVSGSGVTARLPLVERSAATVSAPSGDESDVVGVMGAVAYAAGPIGVIPAVVVVEDGTVWATDGHRHASGATTHTQPAVVPAAAVPYMVRVGATRLIASGESVFAAGPAGSVEATTLGIKPVRPAVALTPGADAVRFRTADLVGKIRKVSTMGDDVVVSVTPSGTEISVSGSEGTARAVMDAVGSVRAAVSAKALLAALGAAGGDVQISLSPDSRTLVVVGTTTGAMAVAAHI